MKEHPELSGTHRIIVESREGKDYLKIEAEVKGEVTNTYISKIVRELKSKFKSSLFIRVDEIQIMPFGILKAAEHKAKSLIDKRHQRNRGTS